MSWAGLVVVVYMALFWLVVSCRRFKCVRVRFILKQFKPLTSDYRRLYRVIGLGCGGGWSGLGGSVCSGHKNNPPVKAG